MAKRASGRGGRPTGTVTGAVEPIDAAEVPVVGLREPCPCGSGRRYKACHGRAEQASAPSRPFAGIAYECDLVAMRELVPSATAPLALRTPAERSVTLATVLPMAWPALVRQDGDILLGLQVTTGTGDPSRDLGSALTRALQAEPGNPVPPARDAAGAPRLQDLIDLDAPLAVSVHGNFDFWVEADEVSPEVRASLERAGSHAHPTERLGAVEAAYWTRMGEKEHVRWVLPNEESPLLDALARLHAADRSALAPGTRLVGMFRACGLLVPVWELPLGFGAEAAEEPIAALSLRLAEALADGSSLSDAERRARAGLTSRQVTLR